MQINDPEILAETQALYLKYEAALMANERGKRSRHECSGASPHAMRFGVTENLYGIAEIEAFRKGRSPANLARTVRRLDIVAFGRDFASITLEFERTVSGKIISGRQSQVWVRLPRGLEDRLRARFGALVCSGLQPAGFGSCKFQPPQAEACATQSYALA